MTSALSPAAVITALLRRATGAEHPELRMARCSRAAWPRLRERPKNSSTLLQAVENRSYCGGSFTLRTDHALAITARFSRSGWKFDFKRDLANLFSRFPPMVLRCLAQADAILVAGERTNRHVPARGSATRPRLSRTYMMRLPYLTETNRRRRVRGCACYWSGKETHSSCLCHREECRILPLLRMCSSLHRSR
jgi:hypothetical protein